MRKLRVLPPPAAPATAPVVLSGSPTAPATNVVPITAVHARRRPHCGCRSCSMARHPAFAGRTG